MAALAAENMELATPAPAESKKLEEMEVEELGTVLVDKNEKIGQRMRTVFFLRTKGGEAAVQELCKGLTIKKDSSLLRHEIAFVLGQMQMTSAISTLQEILKDKEDCPVVRHEAAEAIGAIGDLPSLALLEEFCEDNRPEVSETCKIAVKRLKWLAEKKAEAENEYVEVGGCDELFNSVDPAPPAEETTMQLSSGSSEDSVDALVADMLNQKLELFQRYRAMFGLRNKGGEAAVLGLAKGLTDSSALFRHEVAYVLGQMEHPASIPALTDRLVDTKEHGMVRHEAAEALGAIGTDDCIQLLRKYLSDPEPLVSESCVTALDSIDYWTEFAQEASASS